MNRFEQFPQHKSSGDRSRELYAKQLKREKKYANDLAMTFAQLKLVEGAEKALTSISSEEIMEADATRINELKGKDKLTPEEKSELRMREKGELHLDIFEERDIQPRIFGVGLTPNKELFYPRYEVSGVMDGKEYLLTRRVYPKMSEAEIEAESKRMESFYMSDWQGPTVEEYEGSVDGKPISAAMARQLFKNYVPFAKKRSEELRELKGEKEEERYGHRLEQSYESRVVDAPGGDLK